MLPAPPPTETLESARLLHDQAQFLLGDEAAYAASLRDYRKMASGLLAIVISIGIFRLELTRPPGEVLAVPVWTAVAIRCLLPAAVLLILAGSYFIYTERGFFREFAFLNPPPPPGRGGALAILYLRQDVLADFSEKPPLEVVRMKTDGLRLAYIRLRDANRRVRARLAAGTALVFAGLVLILLTFALYTLTMNLGEIHAHGRAHDASTAAQSPAGP